MRPAQACGVPPPHLMQMLTGRSTGAGADTAAAMSAANARPNPAQAATAASITKARTIGVGIDRVAKGVRVVPRPTRPGAHGAGW
jgi:hypothetical protein